MKTGRNELCPCGSGKKYKKCCLNSNNVMNSELNSLSLNFYQLIILKYFSEEHFNIDLELYRLESEIFDSLPDLNKSNVEILKNYLSCCELLIKEIASKNTTYEMIFWSRRLGPKNIFNTSELSVMLYRDIQSLCIYKYGKEDENLYIDVEKGVFPRSLEKYVNMKYFDFLNEIKEERLPTNISNVISDVIRIEILSFLFLRCTQDYRIANKGGKITIDKSSKKIISTIDEDLSFLINLYDDRLSCSNIFSMTGAYIKAIEIQKNEPYFCPHFQLNVNHKVRVNLFKFNNESYKTELQSNDEVKADVNYLLIPLNLNNIYNYLQLFAEEFEEYYSFSLKDFIVFLGYLGYKVLIDISTSIGAQVNILNRAYTISYYDLKFLVEDFERIYPELYKIIFKEEIIRNCNIESILSRFLLNSNNKEDLDLWTRGPKRFLYQLSSNHIVIDYTGLIEIISYIVKEITSTDGEIGNRRATYFEDMLVKEIENVFGHDKTWICRKEINSLTEKKEIDASFIIDDILIIVEAKAVNSSFGYDKGDKISLEFRTNKMKGALRESNEKAEFIKKYKETLSVKIPANIHFICPIVISSMPEYIWDTKDELFISKEMRLPRILTIKDLITFKSLNPSIIRNNNWILRI